MKKLLILTLVLGLASTASALTLKISVGGVVDPPDTEIFCCPGETLELDIWSAGYAGIADGAYWALVVLNTEGTITGGAVVIPPAPSMSSVNGQSAVGAGWVFDPGVDGPWGGIAGAQGETAPAGVYFDSFVFTCEAEGDAIVYLYTSPDGSLPYTLQDTQIIHQIPEPASMLLLGLGGLLLRRRK